MHHFGVLDLRLAPESRQRLMGYGTNTLDKGFPGPVCVPRAKAP